MSDKILTRINELYHKAQKEGLTEEEKEEQSILRKEYVAEFRKNLRGTFDNISFVDEDGKITKASELKKKQ